MEFKNISKPPLKLFIATMAMNFAPYLGTFMEFIIAGVFSYEQIYKIIFSISYIISLVITAIITIFQYYYFMKKIDDYKLNMERAIRATSLYPLLYQVFPVLNSIIAPIFVLLEINGFSDTNFVLRYFLINIGNVFVFALFFGIIFITRFEAWANFLKFEESQIGMTLVTRNILVAFYSLTGTVLITLGSLNVSATSSSLSDIIIAITPFAIVGVLLGTANFTMMVLPQGDALKKISRKIQELEHSDYTGNQISMNLV